MKKIVSYILAVCICCMNSPIGVLGQTGSSGLVSVSAQTISATTEDHTYDPLKSVVETYGDDAFVYNLKYWGGFGFPGETLVITPDGSLNVLVQQQNTIVKVKDGTTFPIDEFDAKMDKSDFMYGYEDQVIFKSDDNKNEYHLSPRQIAKSMVYKVLKEYDQVISISQRISIIKNIKQSWSCPGVYIKNENIVSPEDIISRYPSLCLKYAEHQYEDEYTYFEFPKDIGMYGATKGICSGLKALFNDYSDSVLPMVAGVVVPADFYEVNSTVYNASCSGNELEAINMMSDTDEYYKSGSLEDFVKKAEDDLFVYYTDESKDNDKAAFVITPNGKSEYFYQEYPKTLIKVKDGQTLPAEEIGDQIKQYTITPESDNKVIYQCPDDSSEYYLYASNDSKTKIYDILKKYDAVESVSESRKIDKAAKNSCTATGVYINNSNIVSDEDITARYPELGLKNEAALYQKENYTYYSFTKSIGGSDIDKETYSSLKNLFNDYSDSALQLSILEQPLMDYSEVKTVVYDYLNTECISQTGVVKDTTDTDKIDVLTGIAGDVDCNGVVDLADIISLSMHLLGDIELPDTVLGQADCNGDGIVDIRDLPRLKQYIMGDDIKLGKK